MTSAPPADEELATIERAAVAIARMAGQELLHLFAEPLAVRYKSRRGDSDPVTEADEAIEALVRREVAARFSEHGILGEEGEDSAAGADFLWVVDPLDGTANFANGLPIFACSIGVLYRGAPAVGALFTTFGPDAHPCTLHARRSGPLSMDGLPFAPRQREVTKRARLAGVPAGFHYRFRVGRFIGRPPGETRSLGSIAVELGLVACGGLQYAIFGGPKIWDVAGGVVLVYAAGGSVFTHRSGRWRRLDRFATLPGKPLRDWHEPLIAGNRDVLAELARRTAVRRSPNEIAESVLGPQRYDAAKRAVGPLARLFDRLRRLG